MADVAAIHENGFRCLTVASLSNERSQVPRLALHQILPFNSSLQIYFAQDDVLNERVGSFLHLRLKQTND